MHCKMKSFGVVIVFVCLAIQTFSKRAVILASTLSTHSTTNNFCIKTKSPVNGYSVKCRLAAHEAEEGCQCNKERRCVKIQIMDISFTYTNQLFGFKATNLPIKQIIHCSQYMEKMYISPHFTLFHPPGA